MITDTATGVQTKNIICNLTLFLKKNSLWHASRSEPYSYIEQVFLKIKEFSGFSAGNALAQRPGTSGRAPPTGGRLGECPGRRHRGGVGVESA